MSKRGPFQYDDKPSSRVMLSPEETEAATAYTSRVLKPPLPASKWGVDVDPGGLPERGRFAADEDYGTVDEEPISNKNVESNTSYIDPKNKGGSRRRGKRSRRSKRGKRSRRGRRRGKRCSKCGK